MWESDTSGGGAASARIAAARCSTGCGATRSGTGASGADRDGSSGQLALQPPLEPAGCLLDPTVLLESPRKLFGRLLGRELGKVHVLLRKELARLQFEQRGDEDEELAAGLQVGTLPLGQPLDEGDDDVGDVHVPKSELLADDERQQEVEGPSNVSRSRSSSGAYTAGTLASPADAAESLGQHRQR